MRSVTTLEWRSVHNVLFCSQSNHSQSGLCMGGSVRCVPAILDLLHLQLSKAVLQSMKAIVSCMTMLGSSTAPHHRATAFCSWADSAQLHGSSQKANSRPGCIQHMRRTAEDGHACFACRQAGFSQRLLHHICFTRYLCFC